MISRIIASTLMAIGLIAATPPAAAASVAAPDTATQVFKTTPIKKSDGSRWRIGYVESGEYSDYPATLAARSEEHTSELQSLMRISYAVFCLKKKNTNNMRTIATP